MPEADLVLRDGTVWTGRAGAGDCQSVAVADGRVAAVGSDAEVDVLVGPATRVVELEGRFVAPGFIDSHVHFISGGFKLAGVSLRNAATPEDFIHRIGAFAATLAPGAWITGGDWDHENWGGELPRREWIDSVTPDNPVFVNRLDAHMGLANSLALKLAGVTDATKDPPGGAIQRGPGGSPTGILKDEAMPLVASVVTEPGDADRDRALDAAVAHALARGVTQVHDMGSLYDRSSWSDLTTYRRALGEGRLGVRVYSVAPMATWERMRDLVAREGRGDARLWWGGLKAFVDGSLGSTTAWFHEPYTDAPGTSGLMATDAATLRRWILEVDAAGLQPIVHAIGDRANEWLLDVFAEARERNGPGDCRPRIEHAQHLTRPAIPRFAALDVVASMQPYHAADDGRWAEKRIGPERARTAYAFRSLLDAGARLAFGSDWTVAPMDPLLGIQAAVTRQTLDGANPDGWIPGEKIGVEDALRAYTLNAAYAGFVEKETGSLAVGKQADLVILSHDPRPVDPDEIGKVHVDTTVVGGQVLHDRSG